MQNFAFLLFSWWSSLFPYSISASVSRFHVFAETYCISSNKRPLPNKFLPNKFLPNPLVHNIRQVPPSKKHPSPLHHFLSNIIKGTICISLTRMMRYLIFYKHTYQYLSAKCIMVLTMAGLITNHFYTRLQSMAGARVSFFKNNYISNKGLKMAFHSWDLVEFCHTLQMGRYHEQDT